MPLFRTPQPGKLCVQHGNGLGSGLCGRGPQGDGFGGQRNQSAAGSLVASEGSAATRSQEAQLQRRFIKEDRRVVAMVSSGHHIRSPGGDKQVESAYCTGTYGRNSLSTRETTYPAKSINSHGRRRWPMTARSEIGGDDDGTPRASVEYGHVQFRGPTIRNDGEHLRLDKSRAPRRTGSLLPWLRGENIQLVSGLLKQVTT